MTAAAPPSITALHRRRLREVYRSAGWPCLDALEIELLAAGLLERVRAPSVAPVVHEVKVQRADLLGDLRNPDKRAAYLQLSSECWYVIRAGIAEPDEIPAECGVLVAGATELVVARPAPKRLPQMGFGVWMALARATPLEGWRLDDAQAHLGDTH